MKTAAVAVTDLLGSGFVRSLAHPGENVTGISNVAPDLVGKRLALLKESVVTMQRMAVLNYPDNPLTIRESAAAAPQQRRLALILR
jgi:putative ABC transport system substrate-binding protein